MIKTKFSQEELNLIQVEYPIKGSLYCSEILNRTKSSIQNPVMDKGNVLD